MKKRKLLSFLLATTLCSGMLFGCKSASTSSEPQPKASEKPEKVVMALVTFNKIPDNYSKVVEAINSKIRDKYNIELELQLYGPADYQQKINLALQSGTQLDLFLPLGFSQAVSQKQAYAMDGLIDKYAKETKDILYKDFGSDVFNASTINGHIYGIPVNKGFALPTTLLYDPSLLKESGYTADDIKTFDDLPKIFDAIKQKRSDAVAFHPLNINPTNTYAVGMLKGTDEIDYLTDNTGAGVVIGNSGKVVNLYETDQYKNAVNKMREWYNKGYLAKDVATTTTSTTDLFKAGRLFATMGGYGGMSAGKLISAQTGKNIEMKRIGPAYFDTAAVALSWVIASTSKHPEAAMKLLNLIYTDEFVLNTILYGIEGQDYVKVDAHHVKFPDGKSADTVSYTAHLCNGVLGSESMQYQFEGVDWSDVELKSKENKSTKRSPYFGFTFDQNSVKTEISAITNVVNQYNPGLISGSVDPESTLPKFIKALKDAGLDTVINEKQKQLDKWRAENKK
jgi:putative aldouronate transport system substrate-binding protein